MCEPLTNIINEIFIQKVIPSKWKLSDISPIPKTTPANIHKLRPLPEKILEKAILYKSRNFIHKNICTKQFGYKSKSSTISAIIYAHHKCVSLLNDPKCKGLFILSFDLSKAFDLVPHYKLIDKLNSFNMPKGFCLLINDYLSDRKHRTKISNTYSDLNNTTSGVPQGSVLGPVLFSLYTSDLNCSNNNCQTIKYADDTLFILNVYNLDESNQIISNAISYMKNYCNMNNLILNADKTQILPVKIPSFYNIKVQYPICDNLKYLGVYFNSTLTWNTNINYIVKKCNQRLSITHIKIFFN